MIIINILKIAFLLGFLVFIHELGHFLVAKLFRVKIKQFALEHKELTERLTELEHYFIEHCKELKAIPLGGFVNMLGEEEAVEDERAYNKKSKWQRALILLAGRNGKYHFWINSLFFYWNEPLGHKEWICLYC